MKKVDDNKVFWARDNETVKIPTKREEDAGWDIYANFEEDMWVIQPHTTVMIPTNLRSAFSPKWVAILKERGSTGTKGIAQRCGVIDSGFRNAWMIPITNTTDKPIVILKKGVKVEIMIPGKSDIPFTPDAAIYIANNLRKKGADIYIFNGGFHHSKIMMVDSLYCTVGSTNLNSRSLRYDYEVNAFIFDQQTTAELIDIFERDQENSTLLTSEIYKKRTPWKKFLGWFAHLFTPFL